MKRTFCFSLLLVCLGFFSQVHAQGIFIKAMAPAGGDYGGLIKGGSKKDKHANEIEAYSYSSGIAGCTPSFSKGGLQACKPSVGSVNFLMPLSPGVNQLKYFLLTGTPLVSADFVFEKRSGESSVVYYKVHMENIVVVTVQESAGGGETPTISVEFAPSRIAWATYEQKEDGSTVLANSLGFNLATNSIWNYIFQ